MSISDDVILLSPLSLQRADSFLTLMRVEQNRLETYQNWTCTFVTKEDLAKAGFFYLQNSDRVQCAYCRVVITCWEEGDVPIVEHKRHVPRCPFVFTKHEQVLKQHMSKQAQRNQFSTLQEFGVVKHNAYISNSRFVTFDARLQSFLTHYANRTKLADAGFYIERDVISCFCCGSILTNVTCNDPWKEHRSTCSYIALNKNGGSAVVDRTMNDNDYDNDKLKCKICWNRDVGVACIPCGHIFACTRCASGCKSCAICRKEIKGDVRVYIA